MSEIISSYQSIEQNEVIKKTYSLLALTLLPTIFGAFIGMQIPYQEYMQHPIMFFLGTLLISFAFLFLAIKNKNNSLGIIFTLFFTGLMGFCLAPTLQHTLHLKHGVEIITESIGLTALALFASSAYILITKKNFSFLANLLYAGIWVLIGASLLSVFFNTSMVQLAISSFAVVLFLGYLLYDISNIVNNGEDSYIMATLNIYLDIFNIFINLIRILSIFQNDD